MTNRSRNAASGSAASRPSACARVISIGGSVGRAFSSPNPLRRQPEGTAAPEPRGCYPANALRRRRGSAGAWRQRSSMTSIVDAEHYLFTSESVTEGHPDKMCDQISDAILDAIIKDDPYARVACETATTTGLVAVLGEITTKTYVDFRQVVRDTVREIGYTR